MVVNGRPMKRAMRRVTADLHDFLTFPGGGGDGILEGPFRSNVRSFLAKYGRMPPPPPALIFSPSAMTTWRVAFRIGEGGGEEIGIEGIVEMDVVEEEVMRSRSVYCDQCRVVGWSGHPVCRKRYHFIIRNNSNLFSGYHQMCTRCGSLLHMLDSRCVSCKYEMTAEDFEDLSYRQLEDSSHLLHGVVHANGYGHLLRVNGREGGSKYLTGCDIMSFWDRLCKMLCVRKVTVMDISKKHGMEFRLLHAVTAGHPWYGDWGYEFGAGSYALTAQAYQKAIDTLSNMPVSFFFSQSRSPRSSLQNTISLYWSLAERKLETVRDLFCYITRLFHESHEQPQSLTNSRKKLRKDSTSGVMCAWARDDVEKAEQSMLKVLRAVGGMRWVTWQALKGATCRSVASPELLDYCLKGLGGKVSADGMHVAVRCNPENSAIEYRLEAGSNLPSPIKNPIRPSADQLLHDLKFLYDALLNPTTMHAYKPNSMRMAACSSATKLLDCKQFAKNYGDATSMRMPSNPFLLSIWCHVELVNQPRDYTAPPPELLVLPVTATVADLKLQATKAFRETYLIFQKFEAEQLVDYGVVDDSTNIRLLLGANGSIKVRGRCFGDENRLGQFRMERGLENWIVDCPCGAKDDDGERMLACDSCGVWQHTRCAGINDLDKVPVKFVCRECSRANKFKSRGGGKGNSNGNGRFKDDTTNGRCKDEVAPSSIADARNYGRMTTVG